MIYHVSSCGDRKMRALRLQQFGDQDGAPAGLRLLLDAPRRRNALTMETVDQLHRALEEQPGRTVLLGSSTPDIFSAGADLGVDDVTRARLSDRLHECYESMVTRPGIVIAIVEGPAVGGGAQLAMAADMRVCAPGARWRWVGPGHGLAVGAWILPDLLRPRSRAGPHVDRAMARRGGGYGRGCGDPPYR
jgi:enoyl-CoA hydratase/carnithine racemase